MKKISYEILTALLLLLVANNIIAQEILLDRMETAGGLKLFPIYGNEKLFYYMPDKIEIPKGKDGKKQFSFLKFTNDEEGTGEGGIQKVGGGGLVTFLVNFAVSEQTIKNAQRKLRRKVSGAKIMGPLTFKEGTFSLNSEFQQKNGDWTRRVLGLGIAPIMEGHKASISIRLTSVGATMLWSSFSQAASNINLSFEMVIAGLRNPYEADIHASWEKIAKNKSLNLGARTDFLGVDIQNVMKELRETKAIEVFQKGENKNMDRIWEMAYGKLTEIMFEPANDPTTLATLQDDPNVFSNFDKTDKFNADVRKRAESENHITKEESERMKKLLQDVARIWPAIVRKKSKAQPQTEGGSGNNESARVKNKPSGAIPKVSAENSKTPPSFSLLASYRKKTFKQTGSFDLSLRSWSPDTQSMRFDENIGSFGKKMFNDTAHFREINLDDPAYKIRELLVQLGGQNSVDFDKFVNFVIVSIRKTHQDGFKHIDELKINRVNFNKQANSFRLKYGTHGDKDRRKWKEYEYKIIWNLFGDARWSTDWLQSSEHVIPVSPPHRYREIEIIATPEVLIDKGVRLVTIKFKSKLFGKESTHQVTLRPQRGKPLSEIIRYAHDPDDYNYIYDITLRKAGGAKHKRVDVLNDEAFILVDDLLEIK